MAAPSTGVGDGGKFTSNSEVRGFAIMTALLLYAALFNMSKFSSCEDKINVSTSI